MVMVMVMVMVCIILFSAILIIVKKKERFFSSGYGKSFSRFFHPMPKCSINNNCFKGSYFNDGLYSNMCEPEDKRLLRNKRKLVDCCSYKQK